MSDLTVGQLIDRTKMELMGGGRAEMNTLSGPISTTPAAGTIETYGVSFSLQGIIPGTYLTIDDEMFYVFATNPTQQSFTASRGENSTSVTTHANGARVYVNDPFPRAMLLNHIQDEIRSWGPQVFAVDTILIDLKQGISGYDLGAINPYFGIIEARMTPDPNFYAIDTKAWDRVRFKEVRGMPSADFPSGNGIIVTQADGSTAWSWDIQGITWQLNVLYSHPFDVDSQWSESTELVSQCGLDPSDLDIPQLGAMWRIMRGREARRAITNVTGTPAGNEQVPPLYITKTAAQFKAERDSRLWDAQTRLARQYPIRMTT